MWGERGNNEGEAGGDKVEYCGSVAGKGEEEAVGEGCKEVEGGREGIGGCVPVGLVSVVVVVFAVDASCSRMTAMAGNSFIVFSSCAL